MERSPPGQVEILRNRRLFPAESKSWQLLVAAPDNHKLLFYLKSAPAAPASSSAAAVKCIAINLSYQSHISQGKRQDS